MSSDIGIRKTITALWFRLTTICGLALIFVEALILAKGKAQGWSFYLTSLEVAFEIVVRLVTAALAGLALGTLCTLLAAPVLFWARSARQKIADWIVKAAVFLMLFFVTRYALHVLIIWTYNWGQHRSLYDRGILFLHLLFFIAVLFWPRGRTRLLSTMDGALTESMSRRTALATVGATAALVAVEFAIGRKTSTSLMSLAPQRPKKNVLLITFDALSAEDMSLYGYKRNTTPHFDAFAARSSVFTNYYAASTFTTPCIGVMLTGQYPSESKVYGLSGQLPADRAEASLAHLMNAGGYGSGAFLTNPWAYYLTRSIPAGFRDLPEPHFHPGGMQQLWAATTPIHQNTGFGSRIDEYFDLESEWNELAGIPETLAFRFRPVATFQHAQKVLSNLPEGFFLWVHVIAPHHPYLPDPPDQNKWVSQSELQSFVNEPWTLWKPHYSKQVQPQVDKRRDAYDEFLSSTDRAFGSFISQLESDGKLQNTTVVVSADHGESFEGGVYQHQTPYLTRPVIHIPLIIHTPGQQDGKIIPVAADQTTLAPTILDIAGLAKPRSMGSASLVPLLNNASPGDSKGLAFCQYLERNSIFKPLKRGSLGVIDGEFQYVVYLDDQRGVLRPLAEAQIWDLDRASEYPQRARDLRAVLRNRFPDLIQETQNNV